MNEDAYSNSAFVIRFGLVANVVILEAVVLQLNTHTVLQARDGWARRVGAISTRQIKTRRTWCHLASGIKNDLANFSISAATLSTGQGTPFLNKPNGHRMFRDCCDRSAAAAAGGACLLACGGGGGGGGHLQLCVRHKARIW